MFSKRKALISCVVSAQLICGFAFPYAKIMFTHGAAQMPLFITGYLDSSRIELKCLAQTV